MYEEGTHLISYNMNVCRSCYDENENGWLPENEEVFLDHLKKQNISVPPKNSNGLYPRNYRKGI